ncbi:MAG: hypothetical protein CMG55_06745 [Candidatus Marinimicrobia bacterium]|nr:hypothetical protein [Candidatus Neomarinimicrobiota bacterium]
MRNITTVFSTIIFLSIMLLFTSCEDWVSEVEPLSDQVQDDDLNSEEYLDFLLKGALGNMGRSQEFSGLPHILWRVAGFSDEFIHGEVDFAPDHSNFVQDIPMDLNFVANDWDNYHQIRFHADDLLDRASKMTIANDALKQRVHWWGNVIGGLMRLYLADHWGLSQDGTQPGAVITTIQQNDNGETGSFQTSQEIREIARGMLTEALSYDPGDAYEGVNGNADKIIHSLIARSYLFDGDYNSAKAHAEQGLQQGDDPFELIHTAAFSNYMWYEAGRNNVLFSADPRFAHYVVADRLEGEIISNLTEDPDALSLSLRGLEGDGIGGKSQEDVRDNLDNPNERIPLWELEADGGSLAYCQDIYDGRADNLDIIDWREMELILAEVAINNSDNSTALTHMNNVRTSHGLSELTLDDLTGFTPSETSGAGSTTGAMGLLIEERDKTLWMKGVRIVDQKRFDLWHLGDNTWSYIPIPDSEILNNPNVTRP